MAISWTKSVKDPETGEMVRVDDGVTHEGLVRGAPYTEERRVMSDVYAMVTFVSVWDAEKGEPGQDVALAYHFELGNRIGSSTVDFDRTRPDYLAWKAKVAEEAEAARLAKIKAEEEAQEERFRAMALELKKGCEVVAVRARKKGVKGVRGTVGWFGENAYGPRVGIDPLDGCGRVWTAAKNCDVVLPGKPLDWEPEGGWRAMAEAKEAKEAAQAEALAAYEASGPSKGDYVTHIENGIEGRVFWVKGSRLGMKRRGAPKKEDPIWANFWEVRLTDGTVMGHPPGWVDRSKGKAKASKPKVPAHFAPIAAPKKAPAGFTDEGLGSEPSREVVKAGADLSAKLLVMPKPYCDIRALAEEADGSWTARDVSGAFLMSLPSGAARKIAALLGA